MAVNSSYYETIRILLLILLRNDNRGSFFLGGEEILYNESLVKSIKDAWATKIHD